jgi:hypothetical protein
MEDREESGWLSVRAPHWAGAFCTLIILCSLAPATAQPRLVLAVADFVDDSTDGGLIRASQLSTYLQQRLQALSGGRMQVVAGDEIRAVMSAQGVTPVDLLSRSRAARVAAAVGASQIVTGRWYTLSLTHTPEEPSGAAIRGSEQNATAIFDVWVVDGVSGSVVLQASYTGRASGLPSRLALLEAAREALNQAAVAIGQTR